MELTPEGTRLTDAQHTLPTDWSPDALLHFCTRCGSAVEPYAPSDPHFREADLWVYEAPLSSETSLGKGDSVYACRQCNSRWLAMGRGDTGWVRACGHFMPGYLAYCGDCGRRCKE